MKYRIEGDMKVLVRPNGNLSTEATQAEMLFWERIAALESENASLLQQRDKALDLVIRQQASIETIDERREQSYLVGKADGLREMQEQNAEMRKLLASYGNRCGCRAMAMIDPVACADCRAARLLLEKK